jgi:hypothetical protein
VAVKWALALVLEVEVEVATMKAENPARGVEIRSRLTAEMSSWRA